MLLIIQIFVLIALCAFIYLVFVAVKALDQITISIAKTEDNFTKLSGDISDVKEKTIIALDSINELKDHTIKMYDELVKVSNKTVESLESFDNLSNQLSTSFAKVENATKLVMRLANPLETVLDEAISKISPSINKTAQIISAFNKGYKVFKSRFNK